MHFKWNYEEPTPEQQKSAKELADKLSMSPIPNAFSGHSFPTSSTHS